MKWNDTKEGWEGLKNFFLTSAGISLCIPPPHRVSFPFPDWWENADIGKWPALPAILAVLPCSQHCCPQSKLPASTSAVRSVHTAYPRMPAELRVVPVQCWGGFCWLSSARGLDRQSWQQLQRNWVIKDHFWRWSQMKAIAGQSKLCGHSSFRHLQSDVQYLFDLLTVLLQKLQRCFPRVANEWCKHERCEGETGLEMRLPGVSVRVSTWHLQEPIHTHWCPGIPHSWHPCRGRGLRAVQRATAVPCRAHPDVLGRMPSEGGWSQEERPMDVPM